MDIKIYLSFVALIFGSFYPALYVAKWFAYLQLPN